MMTGSINTLYSYLLDQTNKINNQLTSNCTITPKTSIKNSIQRDYFIVKLKSGDKFINDEIVVTEEHLSIDKTPVKYIYDETKCIYDLHITKRFCYKDSPNINNIIHLYLDSELNIIHSHLKAYKPNGNFEILKLDDQQQIIKDIAQINFDKYITLIEEFNGNKDKATKIIEKSLFNLDEELSEIYYQLINSKSKLEAGSFFKSYTDKSNYFLLFLNKLEKYSNKDTSARVKLLNRSKEALSNYYNEFDNVINDRDFIEINRNKNLDEESIVCSYGNSNNSAKNKKHNKKQNKKSSLTLLSKHFEYLELIIKSYHLTKNFTLEQIFNSSDDLTFSKDVGSDEDGHSCKNEDIKFLSDFYGQVNKIYCCYLLLGFDYSHNEILNSSEYAKYISQIFTMNFFLEKYLVKVTLFLLSRDHSDINNINLLVKLCDFKKHKTSTIFALLDVIKSGNFERLKVFDKSTKILSMFDYVEFFVLFCNMLEEKTFKESDKKMFSYLLDNYIKFKQAIVKSCYEFNYELLTIPKENFRYSSVISAYMHGNYYVFSKIIDCFPEKNITHFIGALYDGKRDSKDILEFFDLFEILLFCPSDVVNIENYISKLLEKEYFRKFLSRLDLFVSNSYTDKDLNFLNFYCAFRLSLHCNIKFSNCRFNESNNFFYNKIKNINKKDLGQFSRQFGEEKFYSFMYELVNMYEYLQNVNKSTDIFQFSNQYKFKIEKENEYYKNLGKNSLFKSKKYKRSNSILLKFDLSNDLDSIVKDIYKQSVLYYLDKGDQSSVNKFLQINIGIDEEEKKQLVDNHKYNTSPRTNSESKKICYTKPQ